jgi:hypothetical protein
VDTVSVDTRRLIDLDLKLESRALVQHSLGLVDGARLLRVRPECHLYRPAGHHCTRA